MEKTAIYAVSTGPLLKREDYKRTEHDSDFSEWKILIGPCDWEDYLLNKEGAERYRTHNLPNCSSCSGLYELGIPVSLPRLEGKGSSKLDSKHIIPVYLGEADNVRTRLQHYGRDGAHLENGCLNGDPNYRKVPGLFADIFSKGFAVAFRWAPMESKNDAKETETQLLKTFDYAWNKGMNGERRPSDIHRKLNISTSSKSFYIKPEDTNILPRIFKFNQSRPTLVSKERDTNNNNNNSEADSCGVSLGRGSMCTKPPVEGRKRCVDHKGMKGNEFCSQHNTNHSSRVLDLFESSNSSTCGALTKRGTSCSRRTTGGQRCHQH